MEQTLISFGVERFKEFLKGEPKQTESGIKYIIL